MDVFPDVSLPSGETAPLVALKEELDAVKAGFLKQGIVVVLDCYPFFLRTLVGTLAV